MSFQGDVRGIGLAELLQGLARGRKEGVLTLTSKAGLRCTLGLEEGKAFPLPNDDEDPERWRQRARDAWADDPGVRADYLRMSEIARAQRLENLYRLLDGGGVHFRFDPGALPKPGQTTDEDGQEVHSQIHCDGIQIEFLLLEYARVADELEGQPEARELPDDLAPVVFDPSAARGTPPKFLQQCNGTSVLKEIGDRLGWPIRQVRLALGPALASGALRIAHPNEVLALALMELARKHFSRAAVRLHAWCRDASPGPISADTAEQLANEWLSGRLAVALQAMPRRSRRTLLRRLDHTLRNPSQSVVHWLEIERMDRTDRLARMRRMAAEFREGSDPERPGVRELLDLARDLRDAGSPRRGGPLLVMAAHLQPANMTLQLELGVGLVAAGRTLEGAPWILTAGRELLEQGHADRAIGPLRTLLEKDPRNRECRQLLSRARRQSTQVKKLRKNMLVALSGGAMLSAAAVVKVQQDRRQERHLEEVRTLIDDPAAAMAKLREYFEDEDSEAVQTLLLEIEERERLLEFGQRSDWLALYHAAQMECAKGDPLVALEKVCALPDPPRLQLIQEPWPEPHDLLQSLVDHMHDELEALGPPVEGSPQQEEREVELDEQADAVMVGLLAADVGADPQPFVGRLEELRERVVERQAARAQLARQRRHAKNLEKQDELLRLAETATRAGDFPRALQYYREILALDDSGKVAAVLRDEMARVEARNNAVLDARRLAREGRHLDAIDVLEGTFEDPSVFMLPWKVDSYPTGVRVEVGDDRVSTTPFDIETTVGERLTLRFEAPGFDDRTLQIERPANRFVHLSRTSERHWSGEGRVDAVPVAVGEDHVVACRGGIVARIGPDGAVRWRSEIETLSGIARAPVFLPQRPDHLLAITEDGAVWLIDVESGRLQGPWEMGSAPVVGPAPNAGHVRVRLSDGRLAVWRDSLKPLLVDPDADGAAVGVDGDYRYGSDCGLHVARRRSSTAVTAQNPWSDWVVEVLDEVFLAYREDDPDAGYAVLRTGQWGYVAWEAASPFAPEGRLWVSDGAGVRAFVPLPIPEAR